MSGAWPSYIMATMGISTLRSYRGAQIADAIGLDKDVDMCFGGISIQLGGVGFEQMALRFLRVRDRGFPSGGSTYEPPALLTRSFATPHNNLVEASPIRGELGFKPARLYDREQIPVDSPESALHIVNRALRLHLSGGSQHTCHRAESSLRLLQHRRGRRGSSARPTHAQRRLHEVSSHAGGHRILSERTRVADQDGAMSHTWREW